jgi:hypothetical protein
MIVRRMLGVIGLGSSPDADTVEIAVLRHQLAVLHRQVLRPLQATGPDVAGIVGQAPTATRGHFSSGADTSFTASR